MKWVNTNDLMPHRTNSTDEDLRFMNGSSLVRVKKFEQGPSEMLIRCGPMLVMETVSIENTNVILIATSILLGICGPTGMVMNYYLYNWDE